MDILPRILRSDILLRHPDKIYNDPREARFSVEKRVAADRRPDHIRGERNAEGHGWLLRATGEPAPVLKYYRII